MTQRQRLDRELVRRGLAASRSEAQTAIAAGRVLVAGSTATSPTRLTAAAESIVLEGPPARFVSRGGEKLAAALERFSVDVDGRRALDAGASTGGFTDCLLQAGASEVVAVDVGRGQLHERLVSDRRVRSIDRTNVRHVSLEDVGGIPFDVVVADLSFISLTVVFPVLLGPLAGEGSDAVLLVKPQFEAGRQEASRGRGVIRDAAVWQRVLENVASSIREHGAVMMGGMVSPLLGADGNVEFLVHARPHGVAVGNEIDLGALVADAQAKVEAS